MVKGIDIFKKHFTGQEGKYVLIGGAACDLAMSEAGIKRQSLVEVIENLKKIFNLT